jgi:hypothetical protein
MLPLRSSNARLALAGALALALAACTNANSGGATSASASPAPGAAVGFVRMDDLVKVHPLYSELTRLDDDMAALQFKSLGENIAQSGADLASQEAEMQRELDAAAARTKKQLADLEKDYTGRERAAVAAALGGSAGGSIAGGADIDASINATLRAQAQKAEADAQKNFNTYRDQLVAQDRAAMISLQQSLNDRARRTYDARLAELQKKETDLAFQLAQDDSAERLSLRAKLTNLALDDATREEIKTQLAAIDQKEADQVAALRNRDQAELVALQKQLHDETTADLNKQAKDMQTRTIAKISARNESMRKELLEKLKPSVPGGSTTHTEVAGGVPPDMREKLQNLHQKYQNDFAKDANKTIADFQKFKADITLRFEKLHGLDGAAQNDARKQLDTLQRQRGELYDEMVAQIGREVKTIAQRRGISTVISEVVAPANGVDLTDDAEKDIESLHE